MPMASAPPPPSWSSEWRKRKAHTDDDFKVFQVHVVEQPMGKTFLHRPRSDVHGRIECGFQAEGERVVCNVNALLGKGGMELVEAVVELPESPPSEIQDGSQEASLPSTHATLAHLLAHPLTCPRRHNPHSPSPHAGAGSGGAASSPPPPRASPASCGPCSARRCGAALSCTPTRTTRTRSSPPLTGPSSPASAVATSPAPAPSTST